MRQKITHVSEAVQVDDLTILGAESWRVTILNPGPERLTIVLSQPTKAVNVKMVFEKGVPRFERQVGSAPTEYLQRNKVTGEVTWRPEKPYPVSGREMVKVDLGLEMVV
jgi:hypothetical protein